MSRIFAKSPYIIEINEASQVGAKVEIYLKNGSGSYPTDPSYTLSKLISSSNSTNCYFDIAPYINNFITHKSYTVNVSTVPNYLDTDQYCYARIKRYKLIGTTYTLINTVDYTCYDGYVYNTQGINTDLGGALLTPGTYYYDPSLSAGDLIVETTTDWTFTYTNLITAASHTDTVPEGTLQAYRVKSSYLSAGNKLEIRNISGVLQYTYYFKPKELNKYTTVTIDFINKFGAWQREFLIGASNDSLNVTNLEYKSYRAAETTFNAQEDLTKILNVNGTETIKTNTGWVEEGFKETIKQILLSDRILINNRPVKITTKQVELQKNINNKLINYPLEFQYTNSII